MCDKVNVEENETWKEVVEFEGLGYEVSDLGRFRNPSGRIIFGSTAGSRGHRRVAIPFKGKSHGRIVSRMVAEAFLPNPNGLELITCIDGDKQNCAVSNLRWTSQKELASTDERRELISKAHKGKKASKKTREKMGKSHSKSVTNGEDVFSSIQHASDTTGVSRSAISNCLRNHTKTAGGFKWNYLNEDMTIAEG